MTRVKGRQLYIFLDGYPLVSSTKCALAVSADSVELCSAKGCRRFRPGKKTWSIDCAGYYLKSATIPANILQGVLAIGSTVRVAMTVLARELVEVGIDVDTISPDALHTIVGDAIITNCRYVGQRGGVANYAITLQGVGELGPLNTEAKGFPYGLPIIF